MKHHAYQGQSSGTIHLVKKILIFTLIFFLDSVQGSSSS